MVVEATKITILNPTVESLPGSTSPAPRSESLDGAVVGLLGNGRPNSVKLLDAVYSMLQDRYQFKDVVRLNKSDASRPAPQQMIDQLLERCDLVITGIGD